MNIDIIRADPTGNATILVLSPVPAGERAGVASGLMKLDHGWAEQVGFVSALPDGTDRLDMMGGEFCGNASLSLAAYLASKAGQEEREAALSVSGAPETVRCAVRRCGDGWRGAVTMPAPLSVEEESFPLGGEKALFWTVRLPGITHIIVPAGELTASQAEYHIADWARFSGSDAFGVLLFNRRELSMRPLVCVPATDSSVWERGCASGTAAVGAFLSVQDGGSAEADISQPGGVIGVTARAMEGRCVSVTITGGVRLLDRRTVEL